jgi:hypothetical protein
MNYLNLKSDEFLDLNPGELIWFSDGDFFDGHLPNQAVVPINDCLQGIHNKLCQVVKVLDLVVNKEKHFKCRCLSGKKGKCVISTSIRALAQAVRKALFMALEGS